MSCDPVEQLALRISATKRMARANIGRGDWNQNPAPRITRRHVDGPYLSALDCSMVWLSPLERLMTKLGIWDAWDVEWRRFPLASLAPKAAS